MSLTLGVGPLAKPPAGQLNADLWSVTPAHALYLHPLDRRIRGLLDDVTVVDTRRATMLHETGMLPRWYLPLDDVRADLLEPSDTTTHCPFKGDASYFHLRVGDHLVEDALWTYPEPVDGAPPLAGLASFYLEKLDRWLEEDEPVVGHPRDPFHRVDTRRSSRHVVVRVGGEVVADTTRPVVVLETSLAPRHYVPPEDVRRELLVPSDTTTTCPYKGVASYEHFVVGGRTCPDVAWHYAEPLGEALAVAGYRCFDGADVEVSVDGDPG